MSVRSTVSNPVCSNDMTKRNAVLANLLKHLMLRNLSVSVLQVILAFCNSNFKLASSFLVPVSQLNLFVNLLM